MHYLVLNTERLHERRLSNINIEIQSQLLSPTITWNDNIPSSLQPDFAN